MKGGGGVGGGDGRTSYYKIQQIRSVLLSYDSSKTSPTNFKTISVFILHYTAGEVRLNIEPERNKMVPSTTNTKNFETDF